MSKTYRVILIDPEARSIRELESDVSLASINGLVGAKGLDQFRIAAFDDGGLDFGWVDDTGLSSGMPMHAFLLPISNDPIAGRCLIIGADERGETCSARLPVALLRQDVTWLGLILPEVTWDHTEYGSRAIVTYSRVTT
jgi:hypothetical protein